MLTINKETKDLCLQIFDLLIADEDTEVTAYRLLYLMEKALIVEGNYDLLCEMYQPQYFYYNSQILNDFIIEDGFFHSSYYNNINIALSKFVDISRTRKLSTEENNELNSLIILKNTKLSEIASESKEDDQEYFIQSEIATRKIPFKYRSKVYLQFDDVYPHMCACDYYCFLELFDSDEEETYEQREPNRKLRNSLNMFKNSSFNKIVNDYAPVDALTNTQSQLNRMIEDVLN